VTEAADVHTSTTARSHGSNGRGSGHAGVTKWLKFTSRRPAYPVIRRAAERRPYPIVPNTSWPIIRTPLADERRYVTARFCPGTATHAASRDPAASSILRMPGMRIEGLAAAAGITTGRIGVTNMPFDDDMRLSYCFID
jgi:hypothetical protein